MKKVSAVLIIISLALALTVVLAGCSSKGEEVSDLNKAKKLVVATTANYFPVIVADAKGFFKEEFKDELEVKVVNFANGPAQNEALTSGSIDIANMGDVPTVQVKANNVDIKVISYLWDSPAGYSLIAGPKSGIKTIRDIKGKKISFGVGTNLHKTFLKYLKVAGLTENDVQIVNLADTNAMVSALTQGTIDAILASEPTLSSVKSSIGAVEITNSDGIDKVITVTSGRSEYLKANPDIVARYLKVIDKTNKWIKDHKEESIDIVANYTGTTKKNSLRKYYDSRIFKTSFNQELVDALSDTIKFAYENGLITEKLDVEDLVDDSYIKKAGLK